MQADSDAQYARAVLEGTVQTGLRPWGSRPPSRQAPRHGRSPGRPKPSGGQQPGSSGGGGGRGGGAGARPRQQPSSRPLREHWQQSQHRRREEKQGRARQRRQDHQQDQQQQQQQQAPAGGRSGQASEAPSQPAAAPIDDHGQPGPRSTARVAHCAACDVFVPRRPGDWEVHVAGIRHRRQLLSLRVHGVPNRLVLSAFESAPDSAEAAQRLVGGKAARAFGLLPADGGSGREAGRGGGKGQAAGASSQPPPELLKAARQLRTEAQKQLLSMFGVGQVYNSACAAFEERQLASVLQDACRRAGQPQQGQQQRQQQQGGSSSSASSSSGDSSSSSGSTLRWVAASGAGLAALTHLALTGRLQAAELEVTMALPPADTTRPHCAALAAALPPLLLALRRCGSLSALHLSLSSVSGGPDRARVEELWVQAWQHVLPALRGLLESSPWLRHLSLSLPHCLLEPTTAYLPQLHAVAEAAPVDARRHVLLALHPRAGRCSLLQLLPLGVLREILDLAAPLQPCAVSVGAAPAGEHAAPAAGQAG